MKKAKSQGGIVQDRRLVLIADARNQKRHDAEFLESGGVCILFVVEDAVHVLILDDGVFASMLSEESESTLIEVFDFRLKDVGIAHASEGSTIRADVEACESCRDADAQPQQRQIDPA